MLDVVESQIVENLNPVFRLRPYQKESFSRFQFYVDGYKKRQNPAHLLFQMATSSSKNLSSIHNMSNTTNKRPILSKEDAKLQKCYPYSHATPWRGISYPYQRNEIPHLPKGRCGMTPFLDKHLNHNPHLRIKLMLKHLSWRIEGKDYRFLGLTFFNYSDRPERYKDAFKELIVGM